MVSTEIDPARVNGYEDEYLAVLWHVAQINPAPFGDREAGELTERIGREIIRRWLWSHQDRDHDFEQLRQLGSWRGGTFVLN
ncbi:hypothetical protein F8566_05085 [Actinomadura rudentiformis]|uniref:Uncharacterized protein n=1 Tax=Actinomadura rudentiformis TaxID=359158 RepID=A0A6H9YUC5_9ACTN|nr:hypothetical protein F8566_05085 [Actinomadura rudentiformis]